MAERGARPNVPKARRRLLRAMRHLFTPLRPDDYLELINPLWTTRELRGRVERIDPAGDSAATVVIRPGHEWPGHRAGQYVRLGVIIDGVYHWRAYSLTSDPHSDDGLISVTPKVVPTGTVSPFLVREIAPGDIVRLGQVEGVFTLPDPLPEKLLFVSAGSGITPIVSMLRHLDHCNGLDDVVAVHSERVAGRMMFGSMLRELDRRRKGFRLQVRLTEAEGRMEPADLDALCPDWREREAFLSGPGEMLDALVEYWNNHGHPEKMHLERFQPIIGGSAVGAGGTIHFLQSGIEAPCEGGTPILVAGEEAGATLPYGCRIGICHTCTGTLKSGRLRDLRTGEVADLGERDRRYIKTVISVQRQLAVAGRVLLLGSVATPARWAGTACLGMAKILENMEIGHNVMHGQWDWMNDPDIHSSTWDWDTASTAQAWKHSHNYIHHTFTNIRGKDKDLGYEIMRIDPHQKWHPVYLAQPFYNVLLMAFFEWGVALHDVDLEAVRAGEKSWSEVMDDLHGIAGKARAQIVKDYVGWPLISAGAFGLTQLAFRGRLSQPKSSRIGDLLRTLRPTGRLSTVADVLDRIIPGVERTFWTTLMADATANVIRNVWAHGIIFCGHFPDQTYTFSQEEVERETRGGWYVRQLVGAANIEGSPLFHIISGNLGFQVEHHLYPDMPSSRYAQIAPRVREICERYELPYNSGGLVHQWSTVHRTILRLAFPGGKPRPKPGLYHGELDPHGTTGPSEAARFRQRVPAGSAAAGPEPGGVDVSLPPRGHD